MHFSPEQIAQRYPEIARHKCEAGFPAELARAVLAGAFIALAAVGAHSVTVLIASAGVAKLIGALLFPAGLAMVLLAGGELFTGNCMLPLALLHRDVGIAALLRNWAIVYLGNGIGAAVVAALAVLAKQSDPAFLEVCAAVARSKAGIPWAEALWRAVLCNVLVCAAVWMSYATQDVAGKMLAMYSPVMLFVLCGTEHCVANMFYFISGFMAGGPGTFSVSSALLGNLLPVTVGNILGGGVLYSGVLWVALFRPDKKKAP